MDATAPAFWLSLLQIIWIDLLLSGDNAVVIALACRSLPPRQRKWGVILGAGAAVVLRILFAIGVSFLLSIPFLKIAGALLLLWIAVKLASDDEEESHNIQAADSLWKAVRTIAIADAVMSLDNVVAIAAAAGGHPELFIFGLLLTIPLVVAGSQVIMSLLNRFPVLVWAGAALLGFVAGEMLATDIMSVEALGRIDPRLVTSNAEIPGGLGPTGMVHVGAGVVGAILVVIVSLVLVRRRAAPEEA